MKTLQETLDFALKAHGDQKYGDKPYVYHINKVIEVLRRFGFTEEKNLDFFLAAAAHDLCEDTPITFKTLFLEGLPTRAIELVYAVTNEEGANRKERHLKTYGKIASTVDAIVIKLSDRIANVEEGDKIGMYRNEHNDFIAALAQSKTNYPEQVGKMWMHLDSLIYS